MWALLVAVTVSIILFVLWRARQTRNKTTEPRDSKSSFQAVAVKWNCDACAAVKRLDGQRYIGTEAPTFPLAECDAKTCRCRYQFHDDRREGERRIPHGLRHQLFVINSSEEQRNEEDRRRDL